MAAERSDAAEPARPRVGTVAAGVPDRILAGVIDLAVLTVGFVLMAVIFGGTYTQNSTSQTNPSIHTSSSGVALTGGPFLLFLALCLTYYFVSEWRYGQTVGKRLMKLRVLTLDGDRPTGSAIFLRTAGRVIDVLPVFYLLGLLVLGASSRRQRVGDHLAGTTVGRA